jgi:phasin family protein
MLQFPNLAGLGDNPALKSQLEAQVGLLGALSVRGVDTMQRLSELNMQLARELVDDTLGACLEALSCNDPVQMAATAMRRLQPSGEHLVHYQQQLMGVFADAQANLPLPAAPQAPPERTRGRSSGARPG